MSEVFRAELRRAIDASGLTQAEISRRIGFHEGTVSNVLSARVRGYSHRFAMRAAEVLDWPRLARISVEERSTTCALCERPFIGIRRRQRYCGTRCIRAASMRRNGLHVVSGSLVSGKRLRLFETALDAFCRACSGDACQTPECEWRALSPLPLVRDRLA